MIRHETRVRPAPVPIALPLVEVVIPSDGPITVTVDGVRLEPATPLDRSTLRAQMVELARVRGTALHVRVEEAGQPPFTDVVTPDDATTPPEDGPDHDRVPRVTPQSPDLDQAFQVTDFDGLLVGLTGDGFLPGEHVAFAVIVTRNQADDYGIASLRLPSAVLRRRPGPFVLFGQTSGTLVLADPFGGDQR